MIQFKKAERKGAPPKIAIMGPSGSGKTYSALAFATGYTGGRGIALIDSENSASIYGKDFNFDVCNVSPRHQDTPQGRKEMFFWNDFKDALQAAVDAKYAFIILDSATHVWEGILAQKALLDMNPKANNFANWGKVSLGYNSVQSLIMNSDVPIICCYRQKEKHEINPDTGKITRLGLEPIGKPDCMYDYSVVFEIDRNNHGCSIYKNRCKCFDDRADGQPLSAEDGKVFADWMKL